MSSENEECVGFYAGGVVSSRSTKCVLYIPRAAQQYRISPGGTVAWESVQSRDQMKIET